MPTFRKVDPIEIEPKSPPHSKRSQVAREYDVYLDGFAAGDYGRAALIDGERRALVRQRLQAAARRRGLALRFRSGPGPLTFQVATSHPISTSTPQEPSVTTLVTPPIVDRRLPRPPQPPRQRQTATERYRDVLPCWMRSGQQVGRRNGTAKRRPR